MSITIRKPQPEDWQDYKQLRLKSLQEFPLAFSSDYESSLKKPDEYWQSHVNPDTPESIMLLAYDDKKLIGMVVAYWKNNQKTAHVANLGGVYVSSDYQGQGIGKRLLEEILEQLESMNRFTKIKLEVNQANPAAYNLYKKMGFAETGVSKGDLFIDGEYYDVVGMEKILVRD